MSWKTHFFCSHSASSFATAVLPSKWRGVLQGKGDSAVNTLEVPPAAVGCDHPWVFLLLLRTTQPSVVSTNLKGTAWEPRRHEDKDTILERSHKIQCPTLICANQRQQPVAVEANCGYFALNSHVHTHLVIVFGGGDDFLNGGLGYKESLMGAQDISLQDIVRGQRGNDGRCTEIIDRV